MLLMGNTDKYAGHDVVRIKNNMKMRLFYHQPCLMQGEDGNTANVLLRHRTPKPTLRLAIRFDAPGHIATANVTRHVARQKPQVFQELYTHLLSPNSKVRNILFATPS